MSRNIIIAKKSYITQALHKFIKDVEIFSANELDEINIRSLNFVLIIFI